MMQQVNLFHSQFATKPVTFGWRSLLVMAGAAVVAMFGISAYGSLQLQKLDQQAGVMEQQLGQLRQGLARLNQSLSAAQGDPHRAAERERLRRQNVEAQQFFQALSRMSQPDQARFSTYFRGLARHPVSGLWLEEMQIDAGGQALTLRGQALEPSLIPQFLQALRAESSFSGHAFAEVEFERNRSAEERDAVRFQFKSLAASAEAGRDG